MMFRDDLAREVLSPPVPMDNFELLRRDRGGAEGWAGSGAVSSLVCK